MRLASIVLFASLLAAPAARAESPPDGKAFTVKIPAGWKRLPDDSKRLTELLADGKQFDGVRVDSGVDAYQGPGLVLTITWIGGLEPLQTAEISARRQLDRMRQAYVEARIDTDLGTTELVSWDEKLENGVAIGKLVWKHLRNQTITSSRALVHVDAKRYPRMVQADCIMPADVSAADRATCEKAAGTLRLTVETGSALAKLPGAAAAPEPELPTEPTRQRTPPTMGAADPGASPSQVLHRETQEKGSRQWLWIAGLALLIITFYFTTRARNSPLDSEDEKGEDPGGEPGEQGEITTDDGEQAEDEK